LTGLKKSIVCPPMSMVSKPGMSLMVLDPDQAHDFACGKRADEEIEPLHPKQRKAKQKGEKPGQTGPEKHCQRHRHAHALGQKRARVGADAHDDDMRQRPFAGQCEQPVARHQQDVDGQEDQHLLLRIAQHMGQHDQHRRKHDPCDCLHCLPPPPYARSRVPKSPVGFTISTSSISVRPTMSAITPSTNVVTKVCTKA